MRGNRISYTLGLLGILLVFLVINARWIWVFRHGQPLDIDEAGYLGISIVDYYGFLHDGIRGLLEAIWAPSVQAPLTTALAGLFYCVTGPHVIVGFAVPLLSGAAIIAATYFLGCSLGSRQVGLVSAALVASCPIIITYSRSFTFALPTTAVVTMALVALLRSDRFRLFSWASVFGVCLGLMPLARTMTIAFVPGIILGAVIYTISEPADRRQRLLVLAFSLLLALAIAASWLGPNGRYVFHYLLSFGYGNHAAEYGPSQSMFSLAKWLLMARIIITYVYLPYFLVLLAGVLSMLLLAGRSIAQDGVNAFFRTLASTPSLPIIIYVASAMVALASSQNTGDAFLAPIVPAAIVLSVWSCRKMSSSRVYRFAQASAVIFVMILGVTPSLDLNLSIARPWSVHVPVLGSSTVTDGRAEIETYEANGGFTSDDPAEPINPVTGRAWVDFSALTSAEIRKMGGDTPVAFGFRHYLYNMNTVGLLQLIKNGRESSLTMVDPIVTGDTILGDLAWLTNGDAAQACLLLTSDDEARQFLPLVTNGRMVDAAMQAGFKSITRWAMPDGHYVTVWKRQTNEPSCQTTADRMAGYPTSPSP
ncbi:MAG: hypothetical protein B7Y73_03810 [Acidocella sp. 35-58-6]|nr:MAG: hypothetical protein B7Y73_03810 [Acidocella sp. 35-58-6]